MPKQEPTKLLKSLLTKITSNKLFMEVHADSHIPTAREKKCNHYFWEFLMLFLVVFCGFLA